MSYSKQMNLTFNRLHLQFLSNSPLIGTLSNFRLIDSSVVRFSAAVSNRFRNFDASKCEFKQGLAPILMQQQEIHVYSGPQSAILTGSGAVLIDNCIFSELTLQTSMIHVWQNTVLNIRCSTVDRVSTRGHIVYSLDNIAITRFSVSRSQPLGSAFNVVGSRLSLLETQLSDVDYGFMVFAGSSMYFKYSNISDIGGSSTVLLSNIGSMAFQYNVFMRSETSTCLKLTPSKELTIDHSSFVSNAGVLIESSKSLALNSVIMIGNANLFVISFDTPFGPSVTFTLVDCYTDSAYIPGVIGSTSQFGHHTTSIRPYTALDAFHCDTLTVIPTESTPSASRSPPMTDLTHFFTPSNHFTPSQQFTASNTFTPTRSPSQSPTASASPGPTANIIMISSVTSAAVVVFVVLVIVGVYCYRAFKDRKEERSFDPLIKVAEDAPSDSTSSGRRALTLWSGDDDLFFSDDVEDDFFENKPIRPEDMLKKR